MKLPLRCDRPRPSLLQNAHPCPPLCLSLCPSHFMQDWGYLRDPASMEKIPPFFSISCESDRREEGREGGREVATEGWRLSEGCKCVWQVERTKFWICIICLRLNSTVIRLNKLVFVFFAQHCCIIKINLSHFKKAKDGQNKSTYRHTEYICGFIILSWARNK